jgi:hypothetical protein
MTPVLTSPYSFIIEISQIIKRNHTSLLLFNSQEPTTAKFTSSTYSDSGGAWNLNPGRND